MTTKEAGMSADSKKKLSLWQIGGLLIVATISVAAVACDPAISVTFENRTDHEIRVDVRGNFEAVPAFDTIDAGGTRTLAYLSRNRDAYRVVILDERGGVLLDEIFTIEELEARDLRFVVDDEGIQEDLFAPPD